MKPLPIPKTEQLNAMLEGSVYEMACRYYENPSRYYGKLYLTINRQEMIDFLVANPEKAQAYFQKAKDNPATHDVEKIWKDGQSYATAWMDHGNLRSPRHFQSLAEAVAEHVLVEYMMY